MERWTSRDESGYYHLRRIHGGKYEPTKKDLIQRVGQYEDTELEPKEIETAMENCADTVAENQKPLMLDELREMDGEERQ